MDQGSGLRTESPKQGLTFLMDAKCNSTGEGVRVRFLHLLEDARVVDVMTSLPRCWPPRSEDNTLSDCASFKSLPNTMVLSSSNPTMSKPSMWRGSDDHESSDQFLERVRWKRFSNVCTSVVKHDPNWFHGSSGVYIVVAAQLFSKGSWPRNVLHLRLLYAHIPNCSIRKTEWTAAPDASRKSSFLTNISTTFTFTQQNNTGARKQAPTVLNSGVYPEGPPVPVRSGKLLKYVETSEVVRGPHDAPGHWLVTAAKLAVEGGKIGLLVKFALLDYW